MFIRLANRIELPSTVIQAPGFRHGVSLLLLFCTVPLPLVDLAAAMILWRRYANTQQVPTVNSAVQKEGQSNRSSPQRALAAALVAARTYRPVLVCERVADPVALQATVILLKKPT